MTTLFERPYNRRAGLYWLAAGIALLALAFAADEWMYVNGALFTSPPERDAERLFRIAGYLPAWLLIAVLVALTDRVPYGRTTRGVVSAALVVLNTVVTGALATGLKVLVRRTRPGFDVESFVGFATRPWSDRPWDGGGLSFPSEHAAVAFAGALMLGGLYPRGRPVFLFWAFGCAFTRAATRAHYLSDVAGSLLLAVVVTIAILRTPPLYSRSRPGVDQE